MSARAVLVAALVALGPGCGASGAESGLHDHYVHSPELEPCGGNAAAVEAVIAHAAATIGIPADQVSALSFTWYTEDAFAAELDCGDAMTCFDRSDVYSVTPIAEEAIAGAVLLGLSERPSPFLAQGLSRVLGSPSIPSNQPEDRDPRPHLVGFGHERPGSATRSATQFVAYLLQVHGADRMRTLYRTLPPEPTQTDWEAAFAYIYGTSLDAIVETYLAATTCPADVPPLPSVACLGPELASADGVLTFERVLACGDDDVVGGFDDVVPVWLEGGWGYRISRRFSVEVAGQYDLTAAIPRGPSGYAGYATIRACGGCSWLPEPAPVVGDSSERVWLAAGVYAFEIQAFGVEPAAVRLSIAPAS